MDSRQKFLQFHGSLLFAAGCVLLAATIAGRLAGMGMFAFLAGNSLVAIGLHEAYGIIALLGLALRFAARVPHRRPWHFLAAALHLFLFGINILHWSFYSTLHMEIAGYISTFAHVTLFSAEALCAVGAT